MRSFSEIIGSAVLEGTLTVMLHELPPQQAWQHPKVITSSIQRTLLSTQHGAWLALDSGHVIPQGMYVLGCACLYT